jgi:hypothetical protein
MTVSFNPPAVTLGLDPRALYLPHGQQVKSPRLKAEGDDRGWGSAGAHADGIVEHCHV